MELCDVPTAPTAPTTHMTTNRSVNCHLINIIGMDGKNLSNQASKIVFSLLIIAFKGIVFTAPHNAHSAHSAHSIHSVRIVPT